MLGWKWHLAKQPTSSRTEQEWPKYRK